MIYKVELPFGTGYAVNLDKKYFKNDVIRLVDGRSVCKDQIFKFRPLEEREYRIVCLSSDKVPDLNGNISYYIFIFKLGEIYLKVGYSPYTNKVIFPHMSLSGSSAWNIVNINNIHNIHDLEEHEEEVKKAVLNYLKLYATV